MFDEGDGIVTTYENRAPETRLVSTIISEYVFSLSGAIVYFLYIIGMVRVGDSCLIHDVIRMAESTLESLNHLWRRFKLLNHDSLDAIHAAQKFKQ